MSTRSTRPHGWLVPPCRDRPASRPPGYPGIPAPAPSGAAVHLGRRGDSRGRTNALQPLAERGPPCRGICSRRKGTLEVALLASLPMWAFLPVFAWTSGIAVDLRPEWLSLLLGVVLVNGVTEEVIHRGFVFGHLRRGRSFAAAATISAMLFAAQPARPSPASLSDVSPGRPWRRLGAPAGPSAGDRRCSTCRCC